MNDLTQSHDPDLEKFKCPFWSAFVRFKEIFKNILDPKDTETELLDKMSFLALENQGVIDWEKEIRNDRISYHLEWQELSNFFEKIGNILVENIEFTYKEINIFISMCRDKKIVTKETYKLYFGSLIWVAMFDIFTAIMLEKNFWIEKRKTLMIVLKNMQKWAKVVRAQDYLSNKIWWKMLRNVDDINSLTTELLNLHEYKFKKSNDSASCPFMKSKEKVLWIEWVWKLLENNFIPKFEEICNPVGSWDWEGYFFLGKYNKMKK